MMENIREILLSRGCPAHQVDAIAHKIGNLSEQLKPAMNEWLKNESMPGAEVDGYTAASLMDKFKGMQYPAAILLLDWLVKEPELAKKTIKRGIR